MGSIFIDELDISKIGLHDLRRSIALVPQDAFVSLIVSLFLDFFVLI